MEQLELQQAHRRETRGHERRKTVDRALRMLTIREHSVCELTRKLLAKGHNENVVHQVLESLENQGLISNRRFADSFVRTRIAKGQGPILICAELRDRGVPERILEDCLTQTTEFWLQQAQQARDKRYGCESRNTSESFDDDYDVAHDSQDPVSARARWNRQARFLTRRGFPADLVYRVLEGSEL